MDTAANAKPSDTRDGTTPGRGVTAVWLVAYGLALLGGTWFALRTQVGPESLTVLWLPTGLTFGTMLLTRRRWWPVLLLISTLVYVGYTGLTGKVPGSWGDLIFFALVGDAAMWAGAELFWWGRGRAVRLERPGDVAWLFAVVLLTTGLGAGLSVWVWWLNRPEIEVWRAFELWWLSDALGCVVAIPWLLAFFGRGQAWTTPRAWLAALLRGSCRGAWIEAGLILVAIGGLSAATMSLPHPATSVLELPYLVFPVLIWAAVRFGRRLNTTALVLLSVAFAIKIDRGVGPFVSDVNNLDTADLQTATVSLQVYLLITSLGVLMLSTVVAQRKRAAAQLQDNVDRFEVLAGTLRPTLWMMELPGATLSYVSASFARLTGRDPASMLGRPGAWRDIVHPDDRALTDASLAHMIEQGHDDTEYRIVRTDGEVRWVRELTATVHTEDGAIRQLAGSVEDVTHRHHAAEQRDLLETELRQANERYRDFMRISGEAVWRAELTEPVPLDLPFEEFMASCMQHGRMAECNDAFARMYGYDHPQEAVGTGLLDNFRLEDEHNVAYIKRFHAGGCRSLTTDSRRPMPDGEVRWTIVTFTGMVEDGMLLRLWGTITDITAQRRLEEQVRETQKLEAVGELAAGVAHDFNNLLAVISAHTELVEGRAGADEQVAQSLEAVHTAIENAAEVSRSLMAFGQKLPARREPVDLADVIEQFRRMVSRSLPAGVSLELELPEAGLPAVTGDAVQLQQVLLNLVLNARHAMPGSGGHIVIAAEVDRQPPGTVVRVAVQDDGRGMDEEVRRRVYDPFYTTRREAGGTGLGLAVVHGIVRDHGGQIAVSSRPGRGTTVTIELPAAKPAAPLTNGGDTKAAAGGASAAGASILLAEDDPQVRAVMASALEARGYRVFPVGEASEWRRVYDEQKRQGTPVGLVVTDVQMPGGSGLEAVRALRAAGDETPAVVVSGNSSVELDPQTDGRTVLLSKPFAIPRLCEVVRQQLADVVTPTGEQ